MTNKESIGIAGKIMELLTPLESEERLRIISASLTLLGEKPGSLTVVSGNDQDPGEEIGSLPVRAQAWMKQHELTTEQIQQVFHVANGNTTVIAATIPGKHKIDQTFSSYILTGIAKLLATGEPSFEDKAARSLCETFGCYDSNNHAVYMRSRGNKFTGSKDKGWILTAPGLKRGAEIIQELNK